MAGESGELSPFHFNISLTVLEHLGRNLYRNFSTVLGEAISNAWDADANNVSIEMSKDDNSFSIMDDGIGMDREAFQGKFLKIGYTKRGAGRARSSKGRPYIGRKGIGKLALLSCCEELHIITKAAGSQTIGGIINNAGLDAAIKRDVQPDEYDLQSIDGSPYKDVLNSQTRGTYLFFKTLRHPIWNTADYMRKIIALYFRFSLIDSDFKIQVNGKAVSEADLEEALINKTQFMWHLNDITGDSFAAAISRKVKRIGIEEVPNDTAAGEISGFIATVKHPADIKITGTEEKVTLDLFVNGRLREKDILRHISLTGIVKNYLYGQINCNSLDDDKDRFTSSREGVLEGDEKFQALTDLIQPVINKIRLQWDSLRLEFGDESDPEEQDIEKKAQSLFNRVAKPFYDSREEAAEVKGWVKEFRKSAAENLSAYTHCFLIENLMRKYILSKSISLASVRTRAKIDRKNATLETVAVEVKKREEKLRKDAGMNIRIRKSREKISYLEAVELASAIRDRHPEGEAKAILLNARVTEFKPLRNAVMHTAALTEEAKRKLQSIFDDVEARLKIKLLEP